MSWQWHRSRRTQSRRHYARSKRVAVRSHDGVVCILHQRVCLGCCSPKRFKITNYDHDLESYAPFDNDGNQVPKETVDKVGEILKEFLKRRIKCVMSRNKTCPFYKQFPLCSRIERHPELKLEGLYDQVLQWCVCRLEASFAADADEISLKTWDQEHVLTGGHGLMVNGYYPVIEALAQGLDIRLKQRVTKITRHYKWS